MGHNVICNINFDHPSAIYNDGQTVFVNLDMRILKDISIQELKFHVRGFADCEWSSSSLLSRRSQEHFYAKSLIFTTFDLMSNRVLRKGNQKFDLKFTLPTAIPSSIEGHAQGVEYKIKYDVTVNLSRSWKQDLQFEKQFTVVSGHNLNLQPQLNLATSFENNDMIAYIPRRGFVPGEEIPIKIQLKKFDDHRDIVCTLNRKMTHTYEVFGTNTKSTEKRINDKSIPVHAGQGVYETSLKIPNSTTTSTVNFQLINVQYTISITRKTFLSMLGSYITCPIVIGALLAASSTNPIQRPAIEKNQVQESPKPKVVEKKSTQETLHEGRYE